MKKLLSTLILSLTCCAAVAVSVNDTKPVKANEDVKIEAFAHYEFEDSANPGKDSSKHAFDLVKASTSANQNALQMLKDGNDGYVSIRRDQESNGLTKGTGAYLYAPQQGNSSYDFSDMIRGSYTVSFTFKSDNSIAFGDVYSLTFGRYTSCFSIVPWGNRVEVQLNNLMTAEGETLDEKQKFCEANMKSYNINTNSWTNITVSADADSSKAYVYINGSLRDTVNMPGVALTSYAHDDYVLAIGAQCNIYGGSATQFGNVDVKDLQIYDCALSEANVSKVIAGEDATLANQGEAIYVDSLEELDMDAIDLGITDVNSLENLTSGALPAKAKVKLSNGVERSYPVYWYESGENKINGYVQCGYLNPSLKEYELQYNYVCKFDYDADLLEVTDIRMDNVTYVPGTPITPARHTVTFKVEAKEGATLESVEYFGMEWSAEDDGTYYVDIAEGAAIVLNAQAKKYTVTYMYNDEKLGTSKYTKNGHEELMSYEKDGYTFEGWYSDKALTTKVTELDRQNMQDITLYAKFVSTSNEPSNSGCKGSVATSLFGLLAIAGALIISKRK